MKTFCVLLGGLFLLAGCRDKGIGDPLLDPDLSLSQRCGGGCGAGCGTGETCFAGSVTSLYSFAERCTKRCTTTDDCASGMICVRAVGETGGAVCLVPQEPLSSCGHVDCFGRAGSSCIDTNVLSRPATDWCGSELVHCAHGCSDQALSDAGAATPDAGVGNTAGCLP